MTDNDRKSSEDLIREARSRLSDPGQESGEESVPEPETVVVDAPDQAVDAGSERPEHVYRSQTGAIPEPATVSPIGYPPTERRPWYANRWVLWAVIGAFGLGYGLFTSLDDADRDGSGEIVAAGDLDVMTVQVGDCFDDPEAAGLVFSLDAIPCSQPHDNEVFAVESVAGVWTDYPGQGAVDDYAYERCSGSLFDDFVGTAYLDSVLDVFTLTPTPDSWDQGDREVVCALYRLDFAKLTGSARNSGL